MKIGTIRKALLKQTVVVIVVLAIVSAPVFYVDYMYDDYLAKGKNIETEGNAIASKVSILLSEYENANSKLSDYNLVKEKQEQKMLTVSKSILRDVVAAIRKKYSFDKFDVEMSDVKPKVGGQYNKPQFFAEESNVTVKLNSMSDEDVFFLIQSFQNAFSSIKFTSVKISRDHDLDKNSLLAIRNSCFSPLVSADIAFTWSGLQSVKKDDAVPLMEEKDDKNQERRVRVRLDRK